MAAACGKVFVFPLSFPDTSTQSSAWIQEVLERAGVFLLGGCNYLGGYSFSCAYSRVV